MTHNIQGRELSKEKDKYKIQFNVSKSFSGCTVEDDSDFLKPFLGRNPNEITLHVGTGDIMVGKDNLSTDEPRPLGEKIVDLAR